MSGAVKIPPGTMKIVHSLKDIVKTSTDDEIYAALKDCDMDPNEAVNRLILQGSFHEVKRKRDKKEGKGNTEHRSQKGNASFSRGDRGGVDRSGRNSSGYRPSDYGVTGGKTVPKKETAANTVAPSFYNSSAAANNSSWGAAPGSNSEWGGSNVPSTGMPISLPPQPSLTHRHNLPGVQGQLSMADIVRRGRPQGTRSTALVGTDASQPYTSHSAALEQQNKEPAVSTPQRNQEFIKSEDMNSKVSYSSHEPVEVNTASQDTSLGDWSLVDQPPSENGQMYSESLDDSSFYHEPTAPSTTYIDGGHFQQTPQLDDIQVFEGTVNDENLLTDATSSASGSAYDFHKVEDVNGKLSTATTNLQRLSLHEEQNVESAVSKPAVIIPAHLQVSNADCSYLCFGSFESGISAPSPDTVASSQMRNNFEVSSVRDSPSPVDYLDARESRHFDNEQLRSTLEEDTPLTTATSTGMYDVASAPQQEIITEDTLNATHRQHETPSISGYAVSATEQVNAAANFYAHYNSQMLNFAPYSNPAAPKPGALSNPQPSMQAASSTDASTSPALAQHHPVHPYSQPTLPSGHFSNMAGYPYPQSYTYMPSAFQQGNSGSSAFHQSPAALNSPEYKYALPQYKSSFPPSAGVTSGYGGYGSSTNVPGSLTQNPMSAPARKSGYEEALGSHYREGQQFLQSRQIQSENIPLWLQEAAVRAGAYYDFRGQNTQNSIRQSQLPSHYGASGYLNMYQSPSGVSQEHQQRPGEGNLNGVQAGAAAQQSHFWQRNY